MSFSNISDNDDDLFSPKNSPKKDVNPVFDDIQTLIDNTSPADLQKIDSMFFRSKVALSLFDGANNFIFDNNSYNRSIFNTLNSLTDNKFQYHLYADILEESIFRRIIIHDFLSAMIDEAKPKLLENISKVVKVDIDDKFIATYFKSMRRILDFSINRSIAIYTSVCQHVNRPALQTIVDRNMEDSAKLLLSSDSYINNVFHNIKASFGYGFQQ